MVFSLKKTQNSPWGEKYSTEKNNPLLRLEGALSEYWLLVLGLSGGSSEYMESPTEVQKKVSVHSVENWLFVTSQNQESDT